MKRPKSNSACGIAVCWIERGNGKHEDEQKKLEYCSLYTGGAMRDPSNGSSTGYFIQKLVPHQCNKGDKWYEWDGALACYIPYLRLADIYLVYAEACVESNNAAAADAYNKVRARAYGVLDGSGISQSEFDSKYKKSSVTREDIWKERRLELAGEGDYWYDFVRRSYFQPEVVIAEIKAQRRSTYNGDLKTVYKHYYESDLTSWDIILLTEPDGQGGVSGWQEGVEGQVWYGKDGIKGNEDGPNVTKDSFTLPFPTEDVVFNGNMASDVPGEPVDVREKYKYNF